MRKSKEGRKNEIIMRSQHTKGRRGPWKSVSKEERGKERERQTGEQDTTE